MNLKDDDDDDGDFNSSGPLTSERDDYDQSKKDVSFSHAVHWCPSTRAPLTSPTRTSRQKNRRRRNRKKRSKQKRAQEKKEQVEQQKKEGGGEKEKEKEKTAEVEIEYVTEEPEIYDPNFIFFKRIFEAFKVTHPTA